MIKNSSFSLGRKELLKLQRTRRQHEQASDRIIVIVNINENDSYYTFMSEKNKQ